MARLREVTGVAWRTLCRFRAEFLTAAAIVLGWALLTWGVADRTGPIAWRFSAAVLLLSLVGWRFLGTIVWEGLYKLTREDRRG